MSSANSGDQINHRSMKWAQFKDPVYHICLAGAVVASRCLIQEVAGLNPFSEVTNIFLSLNSADIGKTQMFPFFKNRDSHIMFKNKYCII